MHRFSLKIAAGLVVTGIVFAATGLATAAPTPVKNLWATVNICDTKKHPNVIGVRGRMPGNGDSSQTMYLRALLQQRNASGQWVYLKGKVSPWLKAGNAKFTWGENGWNFPPFKLGAGKTIKLRGQVKYQWRKNSKVVRSGARYTTGGHPSSHSDPEGYSASTCTIKG